MTATPTDAPGDLTTTTLVHRPAKVDGEWWRTAVIYQIYPRSFADSNGDGMGDLPGITARLEHLAKLGVSAIWLSPFYVSPQADAGYDVADYRDVDPIFGTLADFDALMERAHCLNLRVIVDIVPNHTSIAHRWFVEALAAAPGSPERERYIFRDGLGEGGGEPPNDWTSTFGGSAWTRTTNADGTPGQWYLHLFDSGQPDLNWDNPEVVEEFDSVLRFWLDRGVDGFRVDVAHGLAKDMSLPNVQGPTKQGFDLDRLVFGAGDIGPMWDQDKVHDIYRRWHDLAAQYPGDRMICAEAWVEPLSRIARYVRPDECSQAFNFPYVVTPFQAPLLKAIVTASLEAFDEVGAPTTWVLSNHDVVRHATRYAYDDPTMWIGGIGATKPAPDRAKGLARARAASLVMLALPGSAYLYQGEELGLPEVTDLPDGARQDPTFYRTNGEQVGRDGCRVPIPWEADAPACGFSPTGVSWLPQPEYWPQYALDRQRGQAGSTYECYRSALRLRRNFQLGSGSLAWVSIPGEGDQSVIAFLNRNVLVIANMGTTPVRLPGELQVIHASQDLPIAESGAILMPPDSALWALLEP